MNNQKNTHSNTQNLLLLKALIVGFCGGIIWSCFFLFMHTFNMTEVDPLFLFKITFGESNWISKWYAYFILIISYGILSIFVAIIYYILFRKKHNWTVGGIYGVLLWVIFYYILPVIVRNYNPFLHYEMQSHIAVFCLFVLYGVFTGYSISYDNQSVQIELEKQS